MTAGPVAASPRPPAPAVAEPVLVPVGHHHGVMHDPQPYITVRLGTANRYLDDAEYGAWLLAHGVEGGEPGLLTAAQLGAAAGAEVVERLLDGGLLTPLPADPGQWAEFAAAYRLVPLVFGLGNAPDGPGWRFWIGLPGDGFGRFARLSGQWAELTVLGYEIWRWSAATRSLAEACERLVTTEEPPPDGPLIQLSRVDRATALAQGVGLVAPLVTGWSAALQPASPTLLVPAEEFSGALLPAADPIDASSAQDPDEVLDLYLNPGDDAPPLMRAPRWSVDPGHPGAAGWMFAIGHDAGPFYHPADGAYVANVVRVGVVDHQLDEADAKLWGLTRNAKSGQLWNRTAVAAAGVGDGVADAARRVDGLVERGLLVDVHPGTLQAEAFARAYQLRPLLHGLGDRQAAPSLFYFGIPGQQSVLPQGMRTAMLWRMAGQWPSLWDVITVLTDHLAGQGLTDRHDTDPHEFLTHWAFHGLRDLLEDRIAYLEPAPR